MSLLDVELSLGGPVYNTILRGGGDASMAMSPLAARIDPY